jgi:hypothetical protein
VGISNIKEAIIYELKIYQEKNKNKYDSIRIKYKYIMIDLKRYIKFNKFNIYINETDEPKYNGKCYNIFYVNRTNKNLLGYYYNEHFIYYKKLPHKETYEKFREIEEYYKIHCPEYKNEMKLCEWLSDDKKRQKRNIYFYYSESDKPTELNTIKIRKPFQEMDYSSTPKYHYNAKNINYLSFYFNILLLLFLKVLLLIGLIDDVTITDSFNCISTISSSLLS